MPLSVAILLILAAVVLAVILTRFYFQKAGETAEAVTWANYRQPLIFEQPNYGDAAALQTIRDYENAIAKLKEHGNQYLTKQDVHCWIHKADADNTGIDFEQWQYVNVSRRGRVFEAFFTEKAKGARAAGKEVEAAMFFAKAQFVPVDFETDKN